MSKLFKLKEWLTVADAAKYLTITFGEEITDADVLRFALDGHLQISVNFINHVTATHKQILSVSGTDYVLETPSLESHDDLMRIQKTLESLTPKEAIINGVIEGFKTSKERERPFFGNRAITLDNDEKQSIKKSKDVIIIGIWDLPLIGEERFNVEAAYQNLTDGITVNMKGIPGAFVRGSDQNIYEIKKFDDTQIGLPDDSELVIRSDVLIDFVRKNTETPKQSAEKPLTTNERNTLLTIIAIMARMYHGNDLTKPYGLAKELHEAIQRDTYLSDIKISEETIGKKFKEALDILKEKKP